MDGSSRLARLMRSSVCPACAWVVRSADHLNTRRIGLPRVCMGGSWNLPGSASAPLSAPRVHGWFPLSFVDYWAAMVCPACAWVVPGNKTVHNTGKRLLRVCMGGSQLLTVSSISSRSAPRAYGWFRNGYNSDKSVTVCPASEWVVPVVSDRVLAPVSLLPPRYQ